MLSAGLPIWTPFFLLVLLILASVWGMPLMLNIGALEGIFRHHGSPACEQCPVELNPVQTFLSWPNEEVKQDQAILEKQDKPEQSLNLEDPKNKVQESLNLKNIELEPTMEVKENKEVEQNKELKLQENAKERIKRMPHQVFPGNVKERNSRLIKPHLVDYRH
ncbi:uncharacterized protein [Drosophila kikkawai]|uniref:Uncharacterized protein isoform X2 n=1 Tax=Drosophila kikkawai TaxID=30033 RepID=A0A6P4IVZ0_DROKI|nr:uncharacterized protein LOC108082389 isoform X2 [Drosophila kikkawai]